MLVLTRKQNEKIQIGENITITILRTKGKAVRVGIEAPSDITVLRGELAESRMIAADSIQTQRKPQAATGGREVRSEPVSDWATKPAGSQPKVALDRVPRSRVATVLPKLLGAESMRDGGPLRSVMARRASQTGV